MTITTCVFDAYGTLFDVGSAARRLAEKPGHDRLAAVWAALAEDWRLKQLQYSWLRAVTGQHCPFWQVTQDGLDWALERHGLADDPALREDLLALYWELATWASIRVAVPSVVLPSSYMATAAVPASSSGPP